MTISSSIHFLRSSDPKYLVLSIGYADRIAEEFEHPDVVFIQHGDQIWVKNGRDQETEEILAAIRLHDEKQPKLKKKVDFFSGIVYKYDGSESDWNLNEEIERLEELNFCYGVGIASISLIAEYVTPIGGILVIDFDTEGG